MFFFTLLRARSKEVGIERRDRVPSPRIITSTTVEVLLVRKLDLFRHTSYRMRQMMRQTALKIKMKEFKVMGNLRNTASRKREWKRYKEEEVRRLVQAKEARRRNQNAHSSMGPGFR